MPSRLRHPSSVAGHFQAIGVEDWRAFTQCALAEGTRYELLGGGSAVVDPWGEVVVEGGSGEALLTAEIDLAQVDAVRQRIPVFEDRRPEVY